jgi:hypothetical protein
MYYLKTQTGLKTMIVIDCDKGLAGYIQISPNRWIDCKWDIHGKSQIETELGSFYNLIVVDKPFKTP